MTKKFKGTPAGKRASSRRRKKNEEVDRAVKIYNTIRKSGRNKKKK